ncbi:hypothetical protein K443DRAFT_12005 [Laccaria amethystina LaAM-08-1]|uniref:Dipeptidylpeptidase IV N-terminal domain-containing protein n=1 Tax=Laccaria amethystina LaAM-08-1 TaxID=1095629 RepID=A0A0C9WJE8_9AGAR|nr:hypothetical protein K443DRAFT_12005 [Laccaria amethystina LaAM-08-1]
MNPQAFRSFPQVSATSATTTCTTPSHSPSRTAFATWSPTGEAIAYVKDNDLYILPSATPNSKPIRITPTGNTFLFHGVPDWVYEEEFFSSDSALWRSPTFHKLPFLSFDETLIEGFTLPMYNPTEDANGGMPYTTDVTMKYPKLGYHNPLVSVHVFDFGRYLEKVADLGGEEEVATEQETHTLD